MNRLFVIGDLHLSLSSDKPMDVFNGWENYMEKLDRNWRTLCDDEDTIVIPGDISWAGDLKSIKADFDYLDSLPGRKILIKGNHDFWWVTRKKLDKFIAENNYSTLNILYNDSYETQNYAISGSRGWFFDEEDETRKLILREAGRISLSLSKAKEFNKEILCFLHYPPIVSEDKFIPEIINTLQEYDVKRCYFGHLHGESTKYAFNREYEGIKFELVSSDYLDFVPKLII